MQSSKQVQPPQVFSAIALTLCLALSTSTPASSDEDAKLKAEFDERDKFDNPFAFCLKKLAFERIGSSDWLLAGGDIDSHLWTDYFRVTVSTLNAPQISYPALESQWQYSDLERELYFDATYFARIKNSTVSHLSMHWLFAPSFPTAPVLIPGITLFGRPSPTTTPEPNPLWPKEDGDSPSSASYQWQILTYAARLALGNYMHEHYKEDPVRQVEAYAWLLSIKPYAKPSHGPVSQLARAADVLMGNMRTGLSEEQISTATAMSPTLEERVVQQYSAPLADICACRQYDFSLPQALRKAQCQSYVSDPNSPQSYSVGSSAGDSSGGGSSGGGGNGHSGGQSSSGGSAPGACTECPPILQQ